MGYTHYIRPSRILSVDHWAYFTGAVRAIMDASNVLLAGSDGEGHPTVSDHLVCFNGRGEDSHETCYIERESVEFSFCKTARKPYDEVVGAVYLLFDYVHGGEPTLSSDGRFTGEEWDPAYRLLTKLGLPPAFYPGHRPATVDRGQVS